MDIQHLVDRLEDLIDEGRHLFGTRFTLIDEERALEIIDQMRISIPEEIERAARILAQRDRILAEANEEAARILQQSRQKGQQLLETDTTVQAASERAQLVLDQARQEAAKITKEADDYVIAVLSRLEQQLIKNINIVRNGINELHRPTAGGIPTSPAQFPTVPEDEMVDVTIGGDERDQYQ